MDIRTILASPAVWRTKIFEALDTLRAQKTETWKKILGEEFFWELAEGNIVRTGRTQLIRRRIRGGKLQRNIRKSSVKGWTLRGKTLKRIPASKRIQMRITAKRSARKRRGKLQNILRKRRMSLRKRKSFGIR